MRAEKALPSLERRCLRRLDRLRQIVGAASPVDWRDRDRRTSFASIEALNLWHQYCRHYYLSCAFGAVNAAGNRVALVVMPFKSERTAITFAASQFKPSQLTGDEPRWRDPASWLVAMDALCGAGFTPVAAATGVSTDAFSDLPRFRNFYAHRSRGTALRAKALATKYVLSTRLHPTDILLAQRPGAGASVLVGWLDDIYRAVDASS